MTLQKTLVCLFVVILVAIGLLVPQISMERTFVESCSVVLRDRSGQPVQGIRVSQSWNAYSYDLSGGDDLLSDNQGRVLFAKGVARRTLLFWLFRPVVTRIQYGVHAGTGIYARIRVTDPKVKLVDGFSCAGSQCSEHPIELSFQIERK